MHPDKKIKTLVYSVLKTIPDPELGVSIWDLGLIYKVDVKSGDVSILMTLTSMGCPLFDVIETTIREKINSIKGVAKVFIDVTFEPPWSISKMSKKAKTQLGFSI
ncbi:MAG: iron-sulfur cluster assembly protein [Patescibacteria group bacterium]|nr:iron-sulfur cluster assembly protein [Patescibacteria group bacterium]